MLRPLLCIAALLVAAPVGAQPINVTFRFIPDLTQPAHAPVVRAYLPGEFNNWGPNSAGRIAIDAPSRMTFIQELNEYRYTIALLPRRQPYQYKVHYHRNDSGSQFTWISDPLNPLTNPADHDNSLLYLTDPVAFQLAREENRAGEVYAVSAGIFGTQPITALTYRINAEGPQDGLAYFDAETGIFRFVLPQPIPAPIYFQVSATDALGREATAEIGVVPPAVVDLPRPRGLRNGITYVDDATVRFSLFAPHKRFVHLIGDFNDWRLSQEYVLYRDAVHPDSVWWWIEVGGLTPGQEYGFQYVVDGTLRIADPFSEKVLDPAHDHHIPSSTYPNLKPYPSGKTSGIVGVIHPGREPFVWTTTDYVRPAYADLVVYELLVRDFIGARNFQTLRDTLGYLERLGINAISLMPVSEFDGNVSWGYNPSFHAALDKYYGTRRAFKEFIDAAHSRGIAVILDVVYNHATGQSPLVQLYGTNPAQNPFLGPGHAWSVFYHLNHDHPFIHDYIDQANARWLRDFRIDGFRFDLSKGFATNVTTAALLDGYNPQRIANLKRMADALWAVDPEAYVILEHFAAHREEVELALWRRNEGRPGMMMWHNMNRPYSESAMGWINAASNLSNTYPPNRGGGGMPIDGLLTYMESHDEQWLMLRNRRWGNSAPGHDIRQLLTALHRQKLVGTFFFTVPGPRMMWQFGELGYGWGPQECLKPGDGSHGECLPTDPGRTAPKPLPWPRGYHTDLDRRRLYQTWAALIHLRRSHPVFTSPETVVQMRVGAVPDRRIKLSLGDVKVVIIGNFGVTAREVSPEFHHTGTWYEFFSDTQREVTDTAAGIWLLPGEARIYATVNFPSPEPGIYSVDAEEAALGVEGVSLSSPYPNPTAGAAAIPFALSSPAEVRLEVFDLLGRRVAVLVDAVLEAGSHAADLDGYALPSGNYVIRLTARGEVATTRLTVVR